MYFAGQRLPGLDAQLAVIDDLIQLQGQLAILERHREPATRLLGGCGLFDGRCDWARIALHVEQFRAMEAAIDEGTLPAAMLDVISSPAQPEPERLRSEAARSGGIASPSRRAGARSSRCFASTRTLVLETEGSTRRAFPTSTPHSHRGASSSTSFPG
ncbi:MAG: hypothetical protein U0794_23015 [Isosphaeraceae bacterium]